MMQQNLTPFVLAGAFLAIATVDSAPTDIASVERAITVNQAALLRQ